MWFFQVIWKEHVCSEVCNSYMFHVQIYIRTLLSIVIGSWHYLISLLNSLRKFLMDNFLIHIKLIFLQYKPIFWSKVPGIRFWIPKENRIGYWKRKFGGCLTSFSPKTIEKPFHFTTNIVHSFLWKFKIINN